LGRRRLEKEIGADLLEVMSLEEPFDLRWKRRCGDLGKIPQPVPLVKRRKR
jgi:hypothetical protein